MYELQLSASICAHLERERKLTTIHKNCDGSEKTTLVIICFSSTSAKRSFSIYITIRGSRPGSTGTNFKRKKKMLVIILSFYNQMKFIESCKQISTVLRTVLYVCTF